MESQQHAATISSSACVAVWCALTSRLRHSSPIFPADVTLDDCYATSYKPASIKDTVSECCRRHDSENAESYHRTISHEIRSRAERYGTGATPSRDTAIGGECEREMELQKDAEKEAEQEAAKMEPRAETDWEYSEVLSGRGVPEVRQS